MPNLKLLRRKDKIIVSRVRYPSRTSTMSSKTMDFIQRICYKKPPTADMTTYGFQNARSNFGYVMFKPLKTQLGKILGTHDKIIMPRRRYSAATRRGLPGSSTSEGGYSTQSAYTSKTKKTASIQAQPTYKKKTKKWR